MPSEQTEVGHTNSLDNLSARINLKDLSIVATGCLDVKKGSQNVGFTFFSQDDSKEKLSQRLKKICDELVALGARKNQTSLVENIEDSTDKLRSYISRMHLLKNAAENDGYSLNLASEIDFQLFICSETNIRKGDLILMDNGNLRVTWKDNRGTHLGLQFLGGGMVQYVIFKQREQGQPISRVTGRDSLEGLKRQINAFELYTLLHK